MIAATPDQDQDQDGRIMVLFQANPEMSSLGLLQSLKESMLSQANVKAIYGGPIAAHSKTVIPVAKIMYGYRTGGGTGGVGARSARWRSTGDSSGRCRDQRSAEESVSACG